jgi:restriction system protein
MKWKMEPNSVFAILLRSPWWISLGLALALAAAAQGLLPHDLRNVGTTVALPFLVIAGIAFWRQLRAPAAGEVQALLATAATMGWPQFEAALREGFGREGYTVTAARDGADLELARDGRRTLVSARRWKAARVGEDALAPLVRALRSQDASRGLVVTLGELTPQAQAQATAQGIEVLQGPALAQLLRRAGVQAAPAAR